jgi:hypothetical protein
MYVYLHTVFFFLLQLSRPFALQQLRVYVESLGALKHSDEHARVLVIDASFKEQVSGNVPNICPFHHSYFFTPDQNLLGVANSKVIAWFDLMLNPLHYKLGPEACCKKFAFV